MSRINTNVSSMIAQRVLGMQNRGLTISLERLSTGMRINRGKDDPAGLIASESLRSEIASIGAAIKNAERAEQVVNVAEGGLQEINNLLLEVQSLVGQTANDAGMSPDEKTANQIQIDSILQTIDRVAGATSFNGLKLLNGNFDYTTSGVASSISDLAINSARLSDDPNAFIPVTVEVTQSAQTAVVFLSTTGTLTNNQSGSITFEFTGVDGAQQFTFASGTLQTDIITAINTFTDAIGVVASAAGAYVSIQSTGFGSDEFVRVRILEGTTDALISASAAAPGTTDLKDEGLDATMIINGIQATANGLVARVGADGFDVSITVDGTGALNTNGAVESFSITGGGANFILSPKVNLAGKVSIGIETVSTGNLGNTADGFLSALKSGGSSNVENGDLTQAQKILDAAVKQISGLRGRLGAFQKNTVGATINSLGIGLENTTAAESVIRDTDFANETANLTRQQILVQAATQALSIANVQPQNVLALLG
ncbi:MAG: flagellin N-terminal helical domain-containing protein [Planctomycetota bacterium]|jgi:flagellin